VEIKHDPGYQHAFQIINTLRQLSKEEAGSGFTNLGQKGDELEIQAAERQQRAGFQVSARMDDVYDALDELGAEVARRFALAATDKGRLGYREINRFRTKMEALDVPYKEYAKQDEFGDFERLTIKTTRAAGDGSEVGKLATNQRLMSWLGLFAPEGQELIKRRVVSDETRDPDFARDVVPFEPKPNPDQQARARMENESCRSRGITGFVPERAPDDLDQVHIVEHHGDLQAQIAQGRVQEYFDQVQAAGFQSLATHQMVHIRHMQQTGVNPEQANDFFQELQAMTREAEALKKQGEAKAEQQQVDPVKQMELQMKQQELAMRDREFQAIEQDRAHRRAIDERTLALQEATKVQDSATKAAALTTKIDQPAKPAQATNNE